MSRRLWLAVLCGPVLWMVHITGVSALASGACGHDAYTWWAHGLTVATALPVAVAALACLRLARADAAGATVPFLGWFGLGTGLLSLLLILLEEAYIWTVRVC